MSAAQASHAQQEECALLFVPLPDESVLELLQSVVQHGAKILRSNIADVFSAQHGYVHVAVDCGGVRDTTPDPIPLTCAGEPGQRFAIHVTRKCRGIGRMAIGPDALTSWDNETPPRAYGRLPLSQLAKLGVSCETFCQKVNALLARGAKYSELRYHSLGLLSNRNAVCTDVVTQCLEPALQERIHESLKKKYPLLIPAVSTEVLWGQDTYLISPNGYAIALGLPHGSQITTPNQPLTADLRLLGV